MIINSEYKPLPWAEVFHASPTKNRLIVGGKGSGKTNALLMEAFMLSVEHPGNTGFMARSTFGETEEILIDPMLNLIPDELIESYHKQTHKLVLTNRSIIYFRALDDHKKNKGLNLGWFGIDELDSASEEDWLQLVGQLRKPGVRRVAMATTNPTDTEHWVYDRFVRQQLPDYEYFKAPTRDNPYLPADFYKHLNATMPESWVRRYLDGEWGAIASGERVTPNFSEKLHIDVKSDYVKGQPVIRVWDFGINGHACTLFQVRNGVGADFIGEVFKKSMTSRVFAQVVARYCTEIAPEAVFEDYGDIAGHHREATSGRSPIDEINEELNIKIRTEDIPLKASLDFMNIKMSQNIGGVMAFRVNPRCKLIIEACNGGYVYAKSRDGSVIRDVPASDAVFEHIMDTVRYGIWTKFQFGRATKKDTGKIFRPKPVWEGTSW